MTETLDEAKRRAKREIDSGAGTIRGGVITAVRGQAETYMMKAQQARAWLADQTQPQEDYKMPCLEIGITGADMLEVCTKIVEMQDEWIAFGAAVEAVRLGKKQAVDACQTTEEVYAVEATVADAWPTME